MTSPQTPVAPNSGSGRRAILIMFIVGAAVAVLAILGSFFASRNGSPSSAPADLNNTTWTTRSITVNGTEQPLAANSTMTVQFGDGRVSVNAGCNQQNGQATWTNGQIVLTGPMASTMMACEQSLMDQDQSLAAFMSGNPTYSMSGESLVITDGSTTLTLTRG